MCDNRNIAVGVIFDQGCHCPRKPLMGLIGALVAYHHFLRMLKEFGDLRFELPFANPFKITSLVFVQSIDDMVSQV
jgi:hypothetical protein